MTAEKKSYLSLTISIATLVGLLSTGVFFIYNRGDSAGTFSAKIEGKIDNLAIKFEEHIRNEDKLRAEDRQNRIEERKEIIQTNKDLIEALKK